VIQRTPSSLCRSSRNAGRGEHAAVAHDYHLLELKALTQFADLPGHGLRIRGIALKNLHRYRAAFRIGQQPKDDL